MASKERLIAAAVIAAAASIVGTLATTAVFQSIKPEGSKAIIASPRASLLPKLSPSQINALPYSPNLLPGGRYVTTPHGIIRVYEWGSQSGRKVVLVHGDATCAPMLAPIAHRLVAKGCRVLILDLYGRGYSDTPLSVPHDQALYATQILYAVTSSDISWTGVQSGGFSVIGFSIGGGIAMYFSAKFPHLVNSVVLLGPAGIIRQLPAGYDAFALRHPALVTTNHAKALVAELNGVLQQHPSTVIPQQAQEQAAEQSIADLRQKLFDAETDMGALRQWQYDSHEGFVHSFVDTITSDAPIGKHKDWQRVCDCIEGTATDSVGDPVESRLTDSKLLLIYGREDTIVVGTEVAADLEVMLHDKTRLVTRSVPGDHSFPYTAYREVADHVIYHWSL